MTLPSPPPNRKVELQCFWASTLQALAAGGGRNASQGRGVERAVTTTAACACGATAMRRPCNMRTLRTRDRLHAGQPPPACGCARGAPMGMLALMFLERLMKKAYTSAWQASSMFTEVGPT